jgi:nucleotide-binding universal stress UspA family protein
MVKRIMVAVDFSDEARRAASWALDLAGQLDSEMVAVTVLDVSDLRVAMEAGLHGFETQEDVKRQVQEWVDAQYATIIPARAKNVRREIRRGIVEQELAEAVKELKADLIVMGPSGIGRRLPLGSKARYLLQHCKVPIALVGAEA